MKRQRTQRGFGARLRVAALVLTAAAAVVGAGLAPSASAAVPKPADTTSSSGGTTCTPTGAGTTCTGTYGTDTAWDWWIDGGTGGGDASTGTTNGIGGMIPQTPSVTVDQTSNLTNQMVTVSWKNFAPTFNQNGNWPAWANQYDPQPGTSINVVDVLQCKGTDAATMTGNDCDTLPAGGTTSNGEEPTAIESYTQGGTSTVFGDCQSVPTTDTACGTGTTPFQVQTSVKNSYLGCGTTTACSIVVLPDWGGNTAAGASCEDHSQDLYFTSNDAANGPNVYADPCAWNDRIVVPISFAPTPAQYCPSNNYEFNAEGSAFLEQAMQQWLPGWCVNKQAPLDFGYNSGASEYEARDSFLSGGGPVSSATDVALVTDPATSAQTAASSRKFTYAPIANTAISVAYYIDDQATDQPITNLKLNARLLAKLLTESYSLVFNQCAAGQTTQSENCDPGVQGNPQSIFTDPEFQQLNPEYTPADFQSGAAGLEFLPTVLAGQSDLTYELTRWIVSDPDARAFLEGQPDPWGMHVNTYYEKSQSYPISSFQVLDPGFAPTATQFYAQGLTYDATMQVAWNPVTGLDNVAAHLANWTSSSQSFTPSCTIQPPNNEPCGTGAGTGSLINAADPAEQFGTRALFAVMDSGTAANFRFPTAQLVNPAGNAVAPTTDSMNAAVAAMKTNPDGITQYQNFAGTSPNAYPLTEVQYAMVPTCGISAVKASAISRFLQNVATTAQYYGVNPGELPPFGGYLSLNDAQEQQDMTAAGAVQSLSCTSPPPDTTVSGQKPSSANGSGNNNVPSSGNGLAPTPASQPTGSLLPSSKVTATASASPTVVGLGEKAADSGGDVKYILPAALAAGALLAIGGPLAYGFGTTGGLRRPRFRRRTGSRSPGAEPPAENPGGDLDG